MLVIRYHTEKRGCAGDFAKLSSIKVYPCIDTV
jgi:hypothetical protein